MRLLTRYSVALASLLVTALPAGAQTQVTLSPSKDNTLYESGVGNVSNGVGEYLFAGTTSRGGEIRRLLLAFDLSGIPAGASVDSVKLSLTMTKTISGSHPAALHRLNLDWGEGTSDASGEEGGGTTATAGDATWLHRFYDTQAWSMSGGDYEPTASATTMVGGLGSYTWGSTSSMVADVQGWLEDEATNFGWILIGNESTTATAKRYDSREGTNPPQLQIFYSLLTSVEDSPEAPAAVSLLSSYPNPFTQSTRVEYTVADARPVRLEVYDTLGRRVRTLANGFHTPGEYQVQFKADGLPAGVYFYRIESGDFSRYRQVVLIR